jgi:hypothetical protein
MLRDKEGNRLFRKVQVTAIFPDRIFLDKRFIQHAGPHQGFGPAGVHDILIRLVDHLETLYPFWEFRAVELTPEGRTARYVFTFAGYTAPPPSPEVVIARENEFLREPSNAESITLEPGVEGSITPTDVGIPLAVPTPQE